MQARNAFLPLPFSRLRAPQEELVAIIDTREKKPLDLGDLPVEFAELRTGDYALKGYEDLAAWERKAFYDLLFCCGPDRVRFENQIHRLLSFPIRALVVEAHWDDFQSKNWKFADIVSPEEVREMLLRIQASGLPVIMAGTHERAGQIVAEYLKFVWNEYGPANSQLIVNTFPEAA